MFTAVSSNPEKPSFPYLDLLLVAAGAVLLLLLSWQSGDTRLVAWAGWQPGGALAANALAASALAFLRLFLAVLCVFLIPGYLLHLAVFPRRADLDGLARLALSFALSLGLLPPLALLLDRLPWGLAFWPLVLAWFSLTALLLPLAALRRWQQVPAERFVPHLALGFRQAWQAETRTGRMLLGAAALALLVALVAGVALALTPNPAARFTEFYLLGPGGLAEAYPRSAVAGQPLPLTVFVRSQEGQAVAYSVRLRLGAQTLASTPEFQLSDQAVLELPLSVVFPDAGSGQELTLELFRRGDAVPYRTLRLFIDVTSFSPPI